MNNLFSRFASWYGKYLLASRIPNARVFTRHDQMHKRNVKPKSLVRTYQLLSGYAQSLVLKVTNNEKNKLMENIVCKNDFSNNKLDLKEHICSFLPSPLGSSRPLNDATFEEKVKMAKFAVEQHNRENGTKVEFVELWEHERNIRWGLKHATHYCLDIKAFDDEGKLAILQTRITLRRELVNGELVDGELVNVGLLNYVTDTEISHETYISNRRQCLN